ncbi:MAG: outer membrane protein assembly factor BamA, partial [Muribaculaceae bacterium]|nr:outer membrane protein assembly factor BamA [Muribaculaceae bacterium]
MRSKILLLLILNVAIFQFFGTKAAAQVANDTVYNPAVLYTAMPRTYEIAGITVEGAPNYDEFLVLGYAGIKVGDRLTIPGDDITNAVKRLMRQTLFSQARIELVKTVGDKAWLNIVLRTQPRIASVNYNGAKKGEIKDLQERLQLIKGNQITQNIVNRAEAIVKKYYTDKGFGNADVKINLHEDLSHQNEMIVDININKHNKVKVHKIYIDGNQVLSDRAIKRTMKKTNEKTDLLKLFSQKKFIQSDYQDDLNRILEKYNEKGYRDARIVADTVGAYIDNTVDVHIKVDEGNQYHIKDIQWVGNTLYSTELLDDFLGMKPGDVYNQKLMNKRLSEDEDAVSNLYMDKGYLFY